jgi:diguanylate cyclase (GGDEF)-like protein
VLFDQRGCGRSTPHASDLTTDMAVNTTQPLIDDMEQVNDTQGHPAGDRVLREVASIAQRHMRGSEQIFRIGGEEFAIVIGGDRDAAVIVAERVRTAVERELVSPTLSAGVAAFPQDAHTREELFQRADLALYAAKQRGRNQVALAA